MLRAENCICGTTTTGTGTLALSTCPKPPGGTDLFQAFNAQSLGTASSFPISYTIIEYTGSAFGTASKQEKGVGLLTLGANLAATTLARSKVQQTAINMDSTATYDVTSPTPVNISTAANTLVFIGASAAEIVGCDPYFDLTLPSGNTAGALPVNAGGDISASGSGVSLTVGGGNYYIPFEWRVPMLARICTVNVSVRITASSVAYGRIYAIGSGAVPTKLLYDFGQFKGNAGVSNNAWTATGRVITSNAGGGFFLGAGEYFLNVATSFAGASAPILSTFTSAYSTGRFGYCSGVGVPLMMDASGFTSSAGDPAAIASLDMFSPLQLYFALKE